MAGWGEGGGYSEFCLLHVHIYAWSQHLGFTQKEIAGISAIPPKISGISAMPKKISADFSIPKKIIPLFLFIKVWFSFIFPVQ